MISQRIFYHKHSELPSFRKSAKDLIQSSAPITQKTKKAEESVQNPVI